MYNENLKKRIYEKLEQLLHIYEKLVYRKVGELENVRAMCTKAHQRRVPESGLSPIEKGTSWGGEWENLWVCGSFTVPESLSGQPLYAVSLCGGREQLFFLNGEPKGIFNRKNCEFIGGNHAAQYLGVFQSGDTVDLAFECYAGHFDVDTDPYNNYEYPDIEKESFRHTYDGVNICTRDEEVFTLLFNLRELLGAATHFPRDGFPAARAGRALEKIRARKRSARACARRWRFRARFLPAQTPACSARSVTSAIPTSIRRGSGRSTSASANARAPIPTPCI